MLFTCSTVFHRYVAFALAVVATYFLLPSPAQNLALFGSNIVACAAIVWAVRRRGLVPRSGWLLLAAFPAVTAVGNGVYFVNDSIRDVAPFPSVGDVGFLSGYVLLAAGLLRLRHARSTQLDVPAVLDTSIITVGFAAASWVIFGAPLAHAQASPLLERLTALGYPVADVMVLAVAARFFLTSRRGGPAYGWLAGTVVVMLFSDTAFAVLNLLGQYDTGHPVDALILAYNFGWGAIALHPGAAELTVGAPQPARPGRWRLVALTAASLIAPSVLIVQVLTKDYDNLIVTAGASALLFLLVVGRMFGLVHRLEQVLTQSQVLEVELERRARHDDLTGLANRRMFTEQVQQALQQQPMGGTQVLYLDLDRFKSINDSLGHAAGDTLLSVTAARLRGGLLPQDTIGRLGGDEFAVLLAEHPSGRVASEVREALAAALALPVPLHGLDLRVTASIGYARSRPGDTTECLLHRADTAMYEDKTRTDRRFMPATGRALPTDSDSERRAVHAPVREPAESGQPPMRRAEVAHAELLDQLVHALSSNALSLAYQPIVDLQDLRVLGLEALARWQHPQLGTISPSTFVACAERGGIVRSLTQWALATALPAAASWPTSADGHVVNVAVNISGAQLADALIVDDVRAALALSGIAPSRVVLEVTETSRVVDLGQAQRTLSALAALGVRLALDDFGTGFSSLTHVTTLPFDILKIDRSFVAASSAGDKRALATVAAVCALATRLDVDVVAEGVEDPAVLPTLTGLGCKYAQGYLFSRPLTSAQVSSAFLAQGRQGWQLLAGAPLAS